MLFVAKCFAPVSPHPLYLPSPPPPPLERRDVLSSFWIKIKLKNSDILGGRYPLEIKIFY